jgi:hypothetical protein
LLRLLKPLEKHAAESMSIEACRHEHKDALRGRPDR